MMGEILLEQLEACCVVGGSAGCPGAGCPSERPPLKRAHLLPLCSVPRGVAQATPATIAAAASGGAWRRESVSRRPVFLPAARGATRFPRRARHTDAAPRLSAARRRRRRRWP